MTAKILVAYASRGGSTAEIAQAIGATLRTQAHAVDVLPMQDVHDISAYEAVIAGSAIHKQKWLPEALDFMQRHQHQLQEKPFAAFLVCLALALNGEQGRTKGRVAAASWLEPVRAMVKPVSEGLFAGVLDLRKVRNPVMKILGWLGILIGIWSAGDHRDWDAIHAWAESLPAELLT